MGGSFKEHVSYILQSKNRTRGTSETPIFTLDHQITFSRDGNKQYYMTFHNIIIPKTFYDINSTNNTFIIDEEGGSTVSVSIDPGNYTITELLTELESLLDTNTTNSNDYTLTYDEITNKVTISFTGASTDIDVDTIANGSTLNFILGFGVPDTDTVSGEDNSINITVSTDYTGLYTVEATTIPFLEILTSISSNNYYTHQHKRNVAVRIPSSAFRNDFLIYENHDGHKTKLNNTSAISTIELTLTDNIGNTIDLNGANWSCEMIIMEYNK